MEDVIISEQTKILNSLWSQPIYQCRARLCPFAYKNTPTQLRTECALPRCEPNRKHPTPPKPRASSIHKKKVSTVTKLDILIGDKILDNDSRRTYARYLEILDIRKAHVIAKAKGSSRQFKILLRRIFPIAEKKKSGFSLLEKS